MAADKSIALIPARGGSKRLPGKNILPFFGHPMLAYGVSAALNSDLFARVIVSSDDPLVGRVAEWYGAEFMLRPPELASDTASLVEVARHVLQTLRERSGFSPEILCQSMPNCPLVRSSDLVDHWRLFQRGGRSFQISVAPYRSGYPHWALTADERFRGKWLFGERYLIRSQELKDSYCPTGAIWLARVEDFLEQGTFYGSPFHLAPLDANRGIDIDDDADLDLAELIVHGLKARSGASPLEPVGRESFCAAGASHG